jgi:putative sigma-54 modulation protein
MKIQTVARKVPLRPALLAFVRRHLVDVLERFVVRIASIRVELRDRNGRRGGGDKRCRIRVLLATGAAVSVEEQDASVRQAVLHATARAASQVRAVLRGR